MPQKERLLVWRGLLKKTAGGLTKSMLIKNRKGKIVSKKKSSAARKENNLGDWLRKSGESFEAKLLAAGLPQPKKKGASKSSASKSKSKSSTTPKPKPKAKAKAPPAPKKAKATKAATKATTQTPKAKPKPKSKPKSKAPMKKAKEPPRAGEVKNLSKISVGNIVVPKKKGKVPAGWPMWTKKIMGHAAEKELRSLLEEAEEDGEDPDWDELKKEIAETYFLKL